MPDQFGLIAMVTAITGFAQMFKDLGLSDATIQKNIITHEQVSTLFWINVSIGIILMIIVAGMSPIIAWFYGEPRLIMITLTLSLSFFFSGLTVQHQALIRRQMYFFRLGLVQIISTGLSISVGIIMALNEFECWSLVWMNISFTFFIAVGTWIICQWLPGLPSRNSKVRAMLYFGRDITGFNIINYFSRNLDNILIGRFCGATQLGFYDRAYRLMMTPINQLRTPLNSVGMPALSSLQSDPRKYSQYYKKFIAILSFVSMPLAIYLGIFSENIILFVLGENWLESANIFRILAITAFIQPVASTRGLVMISCGKTKRYLIWGIINASCVISAFCIGILWGPVGVATAYAIANYAILIPSLFYCFRDTPISVKLFFEAVSLPIISSVVMGLLLILLSHIIPESNNVLKIGSSFFAAVVIYSGVYWFIPGGRLRFIEYCSYPLSVFKK